VISKNCAILFYAMKDRGEISYDYKMIGKVVKASLHAFAESTYQRGLCSSLNMRDQSRSCSGGRRDGERPLVLNRTIEEKGVKNTNGHPPVR
jgi:hypothetical protein